MSLDLARISPGYNASAIAAAFAITGPGWAHVLTASTTSGPGAPLGLTIAAAIPATLLDRARYTTSDGQRHRLWLPRIAVWTVLLAGPVLCTAAHPAILQVLIGATP